MAADHFCLRWNNYQSNMVSELDMLRTEEYLVDVTLCCEGHKFRAHKVILSACSPYFRNVFKENPCEHPVVILKDVFPEDVEALLSFVYQGIVYVSEKKLSSFLQTAELLQIKGLTGAASSFNDEQARQAAAPQSPVKRRKSAPVRIVKQEDGEDTNSTQMEGEEEGVVKNEYSEDIIEDTKNQEDDGSIGEESESEGSGDVNATTYASIDMREEAAAAERERLGSTGIKNEPVSNFMQQSLAARQRAAVSSQGVMDSTIQSQFQLPVSNQGLPELLSPSVVRSECVGEKEENNGGNSIDRNGRRPCPLCTKVISNKSNLLKHMRIRHSDAYNPACCVLCNKVFKNKYSLRAHLNIYHKDYIAPGPPTTGQSQLPTSPVSQPQVEPTQQYLPGV
uniref:Broad-complex core protein n=1 Tax=Triatoma infestans TaxID=30076 RepID=A0A023F0E7_TRIIF